MSDSPTDLLPSDPTIVMIGAGAMGGAMLNGWIGSGEGVAAALRGANFVVVEPTEEKASRLHGNLGVHAVSSIKDAEASVSDASVAGMGKPDIVVLAVKPQVMDGVLEQLRALPWFATDTDGKAAGNDHDRQNVPSTPGSFPLVVTIAAGIPTTHFEEMLGRGVRVVRVMPNMPLQVGAGATAVAAGKNATSDDVTLVKALFDCIGSAYVVDESQIDAVCALSGGGPAYVAYLIEALTAAGVTQGLDRVLAESLAAQTVSGTCSLMAERKMSPEEVRRAVCSPGGTTLAALAAMEEGGFERSIDAGVAAAIQRAQELAG